MADLQTAQTRHQALIGQQDRLLKLTVGLGKDILLPQRVVAHERLGRSYEYAIDVISIRDDIDLKNLIAHPVTLWVKQVNRSYLPISGYVHTAMRLGSDGELTFYQIKFAPWLHFLKFRKDTRIWQDKKATDILAEVFSVHPQARGNFRFDLTEPISPRSYCTQYETDWNFAHRLMEEEGWYSYHEQKADGTGHVLVVTDTTHCLKPVEPKQVYFHRGSTVDELHKIVHWSTNRSLKSTQVTTRTSDYKAPGYQKQSNMAVLPEHGRLPSQLEIYEYTGAYTYSKQEQGDKQSRIRVEEWESSINRFYGVSGIRSLPVGSWFTLEGHPAHRDSREEDRQFLVVAVEWSIENNLPLASNGREFPGSLFEQTEAFKSAIGLDIRRTQSSREELIRDGYTGHCFNRFEVQRRIVPFRSPGEHSKPGLHPQTAIVVGPSGEEVHTDYLNRVKVRFHWDRLNPSDERASCWVRVSYSNAGQGWGGLNVPRIGQEVIVTFLGGDVDRPVITGRLYNQEQIPQWHTNGRLSGYKTKEFNGNGFNQLVLDDTTSQNRIQLYSTNSHAQLNLGYLITQRGNERTRFFGSGFALSTDDFGAIVTYKGLYISTFGRPGAQGTQLDATEASSQLKNGASLAKNLSESASKAGAEPLAGQEALGNFIDATHDRYEGPGQSDANRFKEPILLAASPSGIGLASAKGAHVHASDQVTLSSGKDTNIAAGKSLLVSVAEKISLFASNAGIKLFAAKGKVEVQAQANDLDLIAEKVVRLLSTTSRIEVHAKEEVVISAGDSFIKINASGITNGTSGKWISHASTHSFQRPATNSYVMPHLLKADLQKTDLEFRHLTDWGAPLAGAAYKATLSDGSVRKGTLDALGIARISDVPAGTTAKVEYDYKPLQVSAFVATELHEDIRQLLNWAPGSKTHQGGA
ncbi:type VI secretion system tip protein VgrG [Massilia sp. NEAU-DD11]|uniref:Type VI secretion system tip protein VgrG n=1 Tax=Massilia cellulosiltytica TaxID=2683234 RepID=A0A7X3G2B5_9BURK|nr:type VI secretion system Vgr family protein [Telluria cellulosilytica]MVW62426.1 type VI secretion system tip protein VgrG [Telluria cellulosilytica]